MPIGSSQGQYFQDDGAALLDQYGPMTEKQKSDHKEMQANETSGDFQSRFGAIDIRPLTTPTMPLGSPTEPAGALKPSGGTNIPEKVPETNFPAPYGLNPPEGNAIQGYVKGIEDNLKSLPETFRNIPEEFSKNMEKSKAKTDDERLDEAINIAMSAGAGTMAGVKAKGIDLAGLGHAQVLEANGVHPDEIWKQTGFGRGTDSRWRHEIDDSKASFDMSWADHAHLRNEPLTVKLGDIYDHPDLYAAYPHLKNVQVKFDPKYKGAAEWNGSNTITMGPGYADNQGVLMHEIQHAVQDYEGFARGGAPGKPDVNFDLRYGKNNSDFKVAVARGQRLLAKSESEGLTPEEEGQFQHVRKIISTYQDYVKAASDKAKEYYMRLAGEAEARNVDTRLLMTEAERRNAPPRWTEDLDRRYQIPLNKPVTTSAYGVKDPISGKIIK